IVLATELIEGLRQKSVLLPSPGVIERICAEAITRANRRIYEALSEPLTHHHRHRLDDLLQRRDFGKTDRKRVVMGKRGSERVNPGGRRFIKTRQNMRAKK